MLNFGLKLFAKAIEKHELFIELKVTHYYAIDFDLTLWPEEQE